MVIEALITLGIITVATVNTPIDNKTPQETKSITKNIDATKAVAPKAKPKKKAVKKVAKADPIKQQPTKDLVKKDPVKAEPAKQEPTNESTPAQQSNQSNFLYYILGLLTLGLIPAYFYFRNKNKGGTKIYSSDELKQSLQQTSQQFQSQSTPQSQPQSTEPTSQDPKSNTDDEVKK